MKSRNGIASSLLLVSLFLVSLFLAAGILTHSAYAQTSEDIGFNSVTGEQYECIQFAESKLNTIRVTKVSNGKQSVLNPRQAERKIKRGFKKLSRQTQSLRKILKRLKKKRARLINKVGTLPSKIDRVNNQIAKIDTRLTKNASDKEIFGALLNNIRGCAEDADVIGNFRVFSQVYTLGTSSRFTVGLYYSVSTNKKFSGLRTRISGLSERIPGALTDPFPEAPAESFLTVRKNHCLANIVDEGCVKELPGRLALLVSLSGTQAPGTCGSVTPHRCSASEAVSLLNSKAAAATVEVLSRIK